MQIPLEGHPLHTRSLSVTVTRRDDGRWRARGDVIDLRKCSFVPMMNDVQPAGIIHQMMIDTVVDPSSRRLDEIEVDQPHVAVEASARTGGECCRDPSPRLQALVGETLDAGFPKRLSAVFGGALGCSHLLTLFQLMASALPRALDHEEALQAEFGVAREAGERLFRRSVFLDGHEAADGTIGLGVQLSDFHKRPAAAVEAPLDWLARHDETRIHVEVDMPDQTMRRVAAAERTRTRETLDAAWTDRGDRLRELETTRIIPGLAGRLFRSLGADPADRTLLDTALQLAPGHIQVMAAVTERWLVQLPQSGADGSSSARDGAPVPPVAAIGGMADSCYMWRSGGPMLTTRQRLHGPRGDR